MKGSDIYLMTREMEQTFDKLFAEKFSQQNPENYAQLQQTVNQLQNKLNLMTGKNEKFSKNKSKAKTKQEFDMNNKLRPLTFEEKQALGQKIRNLSSIYFEGILEIVSNQTQSQNQDNIEFDINKLPTKIARELEKYVNDKLGKQNKKEIQNNGNNGHNNNKSASQAKMSKGKSIKGGNQFQKMQQQQPIEQITPQQSLHYQDEQQQQKLYEQRMEVHQQMMKLKQQQALSSKSSENHLGQIQMQQQQMTPQMQQFQAQQILNQNLQIKQNQIPNYSNINGQMPMPSQEQDDDDKKSMSSYLTDSEDESI
eukprot:TRINITY_DN1567_c0_g1_i1.p1 TRINITY_DN1567_c0_g1~~TRINITY_DN1567_c0_g1_i1.p1  ORF type:complete len:310 (-),score=83.41 TRINITY_DN1567_c0_g1_i1:58-987(-)